MADAEIKIDLSQIERVLPQNIKKAQRYLDEQVLKRSEPYTPLLTGRLIQSSIENTETGGGMVKWSTPYARIRYYVPSKRGIGSDTGPLRGFRWFDRMMADQGKQLIDKTKEIAGGG